MEKTALERPAVDPNRLQELLDSIEDAKPFLKMLLPSEGWALPEDSAGLSTLALIAGLKSELNAIRERLDEVDRKHAIVADGERRWKWFANCRDRVVFVNAAGETETVSAEFLKLLRDGRRLDAEAVSCDSRVEFRRGGEFVADIPASLAVSLHEIELGPNHDG